MRSCRVLRDVVGQSLGRVKASSAFLITQRYKSESPEAVITIAVEIHAETMVTAPEAHMLEPAPSTAIGTRQVAELAPLLQPEPTARGS